MRKIIYTAADGAVHVVTPNPRDALFVGLSEAQVEKAVMAALMRDRDNPASLAFGGSEPTWVEEDLVPTERSFRDAWKIEGDKIEHDMGKAREITKARLRDEREPLLADLDVQFMRALEAGGDTTAIATEKKWLRDVTALADTATTVDDLRLIKASKSE